MLSNNWRKRFKTHTKYGPRLLTKQPRKPRSIPVSQHSWLPFSTYAQVAEAYEATKENLMAGETNRIGRKLRRFEEQRLHRAIVQWWRENYIFTLGLQPDTEPLLVCLQPYWLKTIWAHRHHRDLAMRPKYPQLALLIPAKGFSSLMLYLKAPKGILHAKQASIVRTLQTARHKVVVVRKLSEATDAIQNYLSP